LEAGGVGDGEKIYISTFLNIETIEYSLYLFKKN
jgi:hypothetical protein